MVTSTPTPVVIVGAGPVGMFLALDLASRGVRSTVIEQNASYRSYPKGNTHNARTMEHYRRLGLADAVRAVGLPSDHPTDVAYLTRLNGYELHRHRMPSTVEKLAGVAAHSVISQVPEPVHRANQMYVERILFDRLLDTDEVDCRLGTEFVDFDETDDGVTVRIRPSGGGPDELLTARYLVGCDGARSRVRGQLGISYQGGAEELGFMSGVRHSTYLRIPGLIEKVVQRPAWQYWLVRPGRIATLITLDAKDEFRMSVIQGDAEGDDALRAFIDDCIGTHVDVEILGSQDWIAGLALVAGRYQHGRVLICGDAAHLFTPTGGFGMNTGIEDAANLAWKLAAAVDGWAGPHLVDSYQAERRPAGLRNTRAAIDLARPVRDVPLDPALDADGPAGERARAEVKRHLAALNEEFAALGVQLGVRYEGSPIIWPDDTRIPWDTYDRYLPTARPGGRAPHLWLSRTRSLFDVLGTGFTLLRMNGSDSDTLVTAARQRGIPLNVVDIGQPEARDLYQADLALIRPDQHVAWRGNEISDADALLTRVTGGVTT